MSADPATVARLEGLTVEQDAATEGFITAASETIRNMELSIVRRFPQYYDNVERQRAGVERGWCDPLYPTESLSWQAFNLRRSFNPWRKR